MSSEREKENDKARKAFLAHIPRAIENKSSLWYRGNKSQNVVTPSNLSLAEWQWNDDVESSWEQINLMPDTIFDGTFKTRKTDE